MAESLAVLEIFNMALGHVGNKAITTPSQSPECQLYYPFVRDTLLSWVPWTFATTRRALTQLSATPASEFDFQYAYPSIPFPLRVLNIDTRRHRYHVEVYSAVATPETLTKVVLTNADTVVMRYIARVSESVWPPLVIDTVGLWLGSRIAQRLGGKAGVRKQLFDELTVQLQRALDVDGHQDSPQRAKLNDSYLVARGGGELETLTLEDIEESL